MPTLLLPSRTLAIWLTALLCSLALVERSAVAAEPATFRLDLLVFRTVTPSTRETLGYRPGPEPEAGAAWIDTGGPVGTTALVPAAVVIARGVAPSLANHWSQLQRSGAYRPLWQGSWSMTMTPGSSRRFVLAPSTPVDESFTLAGNLRVDLNRYLNLTADLALVRWDPSAAAPAAMGLSEAPAQAFDTGWAPWGEAAQRLQQQGFAATEVYRLTERRRTRSGDVNYLDHPVLGVVFRFVRPTADSGGNPAEEDAAEPAGREDSALNPSNAVQSADDPTAGAIPEGD